MKGCVNDVSECRNNRTRNGLKEMRWNRIKRTSSGMTGKDEFRDFCLREWRELCERVVEMFAGKMCLTDCGVENCAVRFVIVLMKNVAKSSAVRVDEGSIPYTPTQKEQESIQPRRNYPDLCAQPDTK